MAEVFVVPQELNGLNLRQIASKLNLGFRTDVLANFFGIREDTPLQSGQTFSVTSIPANYRTDSSEWNAANRMFQKTTTEKLAADLAAQEAQKIIDAEQAEIDRETAKAKQLFGPDNPFSFDEYTAQKSAKQEYYPYYSELLDDYLGKVGARRDTIQDEKTLLNELKRTPMGTQGEENRTFQQAITQAEQGFAGQGMFFSGIKQRALGRAEAVRNYDIGQQATEVQQQYRDIFGTGRQYETAVAGGVETRRGEALKEYFTPRVMEYLREFPTSKSTALSGYVPPEYLRY